MNNSTTMNSTSSASSQGSACFLEEDHTGREEGILLVTPTSHDILSGRGGAANWHPGNQQLRQWIEERAFGRDGACVKDKISYVNEVFQLVKKHGGRFLKQHQRIHQWVEVSEEEALAKIGQGFRDHKKLNWHLFQNNNNSVDHKQNQQEVLSPLEQGAKRQKTSSHLMQQQQQQQQQDIIDVDYMETQAENTDYQVEPPDYFRTNNHMGRTQNSHKLISPTRQPELPRDHYDRHQNSTTASSNVEQHWLSTGSSDLTIVCRGLPEQETPQTPGARLGYTVTKFPAHKMMMAAASPVWARALQTNLDCNVLELPYKPVMVRALLDFVYDRTIERKVNAMKSLMPATETEDPIRQLRILFHMAKRYEMASLYEELFQRTYRNITLHNLTVILKKKELHEVGLMFVRKHAFSVLTDPKLARLAEESPPLWRTMVRAALQADKNISVELSSQEILRVMKEASLQHQQQQQRQQQQRQNQQQQPQGMHGIRKGGDHRYGERSLRAGDTHKRISTPPLLSQFQQQQHTSTLPSRNHDSLSTKRDIDQTQMRQVCNNKESDSSARQSLKKACFSGESSSERMQLQSAEQSNKFSNINPPLEAECQLNRGDSYRTYTPVESNKEAQPAKVPDTVGSSNPTTTTSAGTRNTHVHPHKSDDGNGDDGLDSERAPLTAEDPVWHITTL